MHAHAGEGVPRRPEAGVGVGGLLLETQLIAFDWTSAGLTYILSSVGSHECHPHPHSISMDSLLAMPPNFQPRRMEPVDIDRIGFLAVPEKEISPASCLPGFFLSSPPPVFLSVCLFRDLLSTVPCNFPTYPLSLHITIDSGLARASLLPALTSVQPLSLPTSRYIPVCSSQCTEAVFWRSALLPTPTATRQSFFPGPVLN